MAPDAPSPSTRSGVVALIPMAGQGRRFSRAAVGSKEVFPLAFTEGPHDSEPRIKVVSQYLFELLAAAGVREGVVVLRRGKWDIPDFYGEGTPAGMSLAYVVVDETVGPPDSLARARPFVRDRVVAFGFPDILLGPSDVYTRLLQRLERDEADVTMALYDLEFPRLHDGVVVDEAGVVRDITLKEPDTPARHTWAAAVWKPTFTELMCDFVGACDRESSRFAGLDAGGDMPMGMALRAAVQAGLRVTGEHFPGVRWTDVGTPDALRAAAKRLRGGG